MFNNMILCLMIIGFIFAGLPPVIAGEDVEGSEDHPMISRYEGSYITNYQQFAYDRQELVTGMEEEEFEWTAFEGEVTRIRYTAPEGRSELEVHRNYRLALQDAGFEIVYECIGDDAQCREVVDSDAPLGYDNVFRRGSHRHYSLARLTNPVGDIYVAVYTARRHGDNRSMLIIIEDKPMETDKVQVDTDAEVSVADIVDEEALHGREDAEGSEDHPMITRYEGSYITNYQQFAYDRQELVTGMEDEEFVRTAFEGEVTRIRYTAPEGRSELEVHRNYRLALQDAGFEIIYECVGDDAQCSEIGADAPLGYDNVFHSLAGSHRHYSLARLTNPVGDIYVAVYTARRRGENRSMLIVLEEQPMEIGMVQVQIDADAMARDIDEKGSVRIYGIYFDTDEATIQEKSEPVLSEIGTLLEENPELKLRVVGHTDAVGNLEYNMDLSQRRAEAVVEFLTSEQGISPDRLIPHGIGSLAPVAGNETEEDRALNRRVELIKMYKD